MDFIFLNISQHTFILKHSNLVDSERQIESTVLCYRRSLYTRYLTSQNCIHALCNTWACILHIYYHILHIRDTCSDHTSWFNRDSHNFVNRSFPCPIGYPQKHWNVHILPTSCPECALFTQTKAAVLVTHLSVTELPWRWLHYFSSGAVFIFVVQLKCPDGECLRSTSPREKSSWVQKE